MLQCVGRVWNDDRMTKMAAADVERWVESTKATVLSNSIALKVSKNNGT